MQFINTLVAVAVITAITLVALWRSSIMSFMLLPLMVAGMFALNHPHVLMLLGIGLFYSHIGLHVLPGQTELYVFLLLASMAIVFVRGLMVGGQNIRRDLSSRAAMAYAVLLLILMGVRGTGFRILGSDTWGGMSYVIQFAAIVFYLFCTHVQVSSRSLRRTIVAMLLLSSLRPLADTLFMVSGGRIQLQYLLIVRESVGLFGGLRALTEPSVAGRVFRMHAASELGICTALIALMLMHLPRRRYLAGGICFSLAIAFCAIAGYRMNILQLLVLPVATSMLATPSRRLVRITKISAALLVAMMLYVALLPFLPEPMQRMGSSLPLARARISHNVQLSSSSTVLWRLQLWRRAAQDIPEYAALGKGLVFGAGEYQALSVYSWLCQNSIEMQVWTRQYHNGPLALLLDFGIPGFIICAVLMLAIVLESVRQGRRPWHDPPNRVLYIVLQAHLFLSIGLFWATIGDVRSMVHFMFFGALLKLFRATDDAEAASPIADGAALESQTP